VSFIRRAAPEALTPRSKETTPLEPLVQLIETVPL
jgi:hypothetical protein